MLTLVKGKVIGSGKKIQRSKKEENLVHCLILQKLDKIVDVANKSVPLKV